MGFKTTADGARSDREGLPQLANRAGLSVPISKIHYETMRCNPPTFLFYIYPPITDLSHWEACPCVPSPPTQSCHRQTCYSDELLIGADGKSSWFTLLFPGVETRESTYTTLPMKPFGNFRYLQCVFWILKLRAAAPFQSHGCKSDCGNVIWLWSSYWKRSSAYFLSAHTVKKNTVVFTVKYLLL